MSSINAPVSWYVDGNMAWNAQAQTGRIVNFQTPITADRQYTFPDKSGTIALIGDLPTSSKITTGQATLSSGTIVVSNTNVTANSKIFLTYSSLNITGSGISALVATSLVAGTSFTINAYYFNAGAGTTGINTNDNSVVNYVIIG